jgi:hypothetical protein
MPLHLADWESSADPVRVMPRTRLRVVFSRVEGLEYELQSVRCDLTKNTSKYANLDMILVDRFLAFHTDI